MNLFTILSFLNVMTLFQQVDVEAEVDSSIRMSTTMRMLRGEDGLSGDEKPPIGGSEEIVNYDRNELHSNEKLEGRLHRQHRIHSNFHGIGYDRTKKRANHVLRVYAPEKIHSKITSNVEIDSIPIYENPKNEALPEPEDPGDSHMNSLFNG